MQWLALTLLNIAHAETAIVGIDGMYCAVNCASKVERSIGELDGVSAVTASVDEKAACISSSAPLSSEMVQAVLAVHDQYTVTSIEVVDTCPDVFSSPTVKESGPWANRMDGIDASVISHGEKVDLENHLAPDKFTIIDFGAAWCGPCHVAAEMLRIALLNESDLAVRAVELGADPSASFDLPAAQQHLQNAIGLPHFKVYDPKGRVIYQGSELDRALAKIDKKRK